jgi:DnaJ family protein C protein 7
VLSDPRRRERYDMGEDEDGLSEGPGEFGPGGINLSELFAQFHGGGAGFGPFGGARMHSHHGFHFAA